MHSITDRATPAPADVSAVFVQGTGSVTDLQYATAEDAFKGLWSAATAVPTFDVGPALPGHYQWYVRSLATGTMVNCEATIP